MIKAKINSAELQELLTKISKVDQEVRVKTDRAIEASARNIEASAKRKVPRGVSNNLQNSIGVRGSFLEREVYSDSKYAPFVEFGTKSKVDVPSGLEGYAMQFKGGRGGSFEELEKSIARWADAKNIDPEAVFPIAMNIAKFGVKAQPFLFPSFFAERPKLIRKLKRILDGIK